MEAQTHDSLALFSGALNAAFGLLLSLRANTGTSGLLVDASFPLEATSSEMEKTVGVRVARDPSTLRSLTPKEEL